MSEEIKEQGRRDYAKDPCFGPSFWERIRNTFVKAYASVEIPMKPSPLLRILQATLDLSQAWNEIHNKAHHNESIMVTADEIKQVVSLFNTALDAQAGSTAALAAVQASLTALQGTVTDLNDPALEQSLKDVLAKAAAATVGTITPLPPATNPDGSPVSGNVTNPDGSITTPLGTVIPAPAAGATPAAAVRRG